MRTAVLSDVHGNLEALEAVRSAGVDRGVERWLCLGDTIGYGADPGGCLAIVDELTAVALLGNHEEAVAGEQPEEYFTPLARRSVEWTRQQLSAGQRARLGALHLTHAEADAFFVHAEPGDPRAWHYVHDADDAAAALKSVPTRLVFVGHSHLAFVCCATEDVRTIMRTEGRLSLAATARYLVNVGSVGQPRDGDPRACFAIRDSELDSVELVRVSYDVTAARQKILAVGLPRFLADRLSQGR
ncbi:MAG: metallophosphoesterase family protein [bacterium]|nr:metallophosphoesterase family protein [bacterium]